MKAILSWGNLIKKTEEIEVFSVTYQVPKLSVTYCYISIPKFNSSQHFIISHASLYGQISTEWFLLEVSHVVSFRYFLGLSLLKVHMGWVYKMAHS